MGDEEERKRLLENIYDRMEKIASWKANPNSGQKVGGFGRERSAKIDTNNYDRLQDSMMRYFRNFYDTNNSLRMATKNFVSDIRAGKIGEAFDEVKKLSRVDEALAGVLEHGLRDIEKADKAG
ncbi:MAG: hypothetical protein ABEI58_03475 [Candidatus Nanohaloarchaea archaeon]